MRDTFNEIYRTNAWDNDESSSGNGSTMESTSEIRRIIPQLVSHYGIKSILDVPCGEYYWFDQMHLDVHYIGGDIVPSLVTMNQRAYPKTDFLVLDITQDILPSLDMILVRDCLGHLSNKSVQKAIKNIKRSGAKYLLATTFPEHENTGDIKDGEWRPINLAQLFGLPNPDLLINEKCTAGDGAFADKSLGLWVL